jgi:hypothetical protein
MLKYRVGQLEALLHRLASARRSGAAPRPRRLQSAQEVIDVLEEQVEALRLDPWLAPVEKARAIAYLAGQARQAIVTGTLAARMEMLEQVLEQRRREGR